jgi:predicted DNA-binding protein (UPF0251 family)
MGRPPVFRMVGEPPDVGMFKPAGRHAADLEIVTLHLDEYEALRLIDHQGKDQEEAADLMAVSRPTISRILGSARGKLARMLVTGAALVIEGGPVQPRGGHGSGQGRRRRGGRGADARAGGEYRWPERDG